MTLREWFDDYEIPGDALVEFYCDDGYAGDFDADLVSLYRHSKINELPATLLDYVFDESSDYMACPDFVVYTEKYIYTPVESINGWYVLRINRNPIYAP
jgi:hypothetical protein